MATSQRDVRNRIGAVKNIQKITRAMEMVAAARLRRAEQRIEALRPYADAIRRMTRQAAEAAGDLPRLPILQEHEQLQSVGLLAVAGDRGLAGAFNSNIVRAAVAAGREHQSEGRTPVFFASGRRPASSLTLRGLDLAESFTGFTDRPAYPDDGDAKRLREREHADRRPHARDEPSPPSGDHAGDPGSGGRGRGAVRVDRRLETTCQ